MNNEKELSMKIMRRVFLIAGLRRLARFMPEALFLAAALGVYSGTSFSRVFQNVPRDISEAQYHFWMSAVANTEAVVQISLVLCALSALAFAMTRKRTRETFSFRTA